MAVQVGDQCKKGHVIEGDNVQNYKNRGIWRVRCKQCNQPPVHEAKKPGDLCVRGHIIDGPNMAQKNVNGRIRIYCRTCHREAVRKSTGTLTADQVERSENKAHRKAADRADVLIEKGKVDNALNYLRLNKRSERAAEALHKKLDSEKPRCAENPGPWIDYPDDDRPTAREAYLMCQGCPMLLECARFATAYKPAVGVWGGEVYVDGRPVTD